MADCRSGVSATRPLTTIPFSDIYEALYRGSWRSERTAIEKNVLEVAQAELASTASERCRCDPLKPEFNPFRFQPAPPLPRPHLHKMLLNGIGFRTAGNAF